MNVPVSRFLVLTHFLPFFADYFGIQRCGFGCAARIYGCSWPRRGKLLRDVDTHRVHALLHSFRSILVDI